MLIAIFLAVFGYIRRAESEQGKITSFEPDRRLLAVSAPLNPLLSTDSEASFELIDKDKPRTTSFSGNCVAKLKASGDLPNKSVTKDGFARSIPSKPIDLKPEMERVIKTTEGTVGHVLKVRVNQNGDAISIQEGGHPIGEGRVVDPKVIVGEVSL